MKTPDLSFKVAGEPYDIRIGDFTPKDAGDYRRAVGLPMMQAFGQMDLDTIAGFVWLVRRQLSPNLSYEEVASSFTYDDYEPVSTDGAGAGAEADPNDPPS